MDKNVTKLPNSCDLVYISLLKFTFEQGLIIVYSPRQHRRQSPLYVRHRSSSEAVRYLMNKLRFVYLLVTLIINRTSLIYFKQVFEVTPLNTALDDTRAHFKCQTRLRLWPRFPPATVSASRPLRLRPSVSDDVFVCSRTLVSYSKLLL